MTNPNAVYGTTSDNGLNPSAALRTGSARRLNGALAVERFERTKIIPPNLLARANKVIR